MHIREATSADNTQLLQLTANSGMDGIISLRIERNPDFFALLDKRGENTTFIAEKNKEIIGCFTVSKSNVMVNKKKVTMHYVSDLKVDHRYRGGLAGYRLAHRMKDHLIACDADLVMFVVAKGNDKMNPFLTGRAGIPAFQSMGYFKIFQLLPLRKLKKINSYTVTEGGMTEDHISLFNLYQESYQLGKIISPEKEEKTDHVLTIRQADKIIASLSLTDTSSVKQNIVFKTTIPIKYLLYIAKTFGFKIPETGEPIRMLYVNNIFCRSGCEEAFEFLLHYAQHIAYKENFHFVSIGIHSKDPLNNILNHFRKITFYSQGFIASFKHNQKRIDEIIHGIPFEDYSLV